ncbi:hypothetical protein [Oceanithermus sp.]
MRETGIEGPILGAFEVARIRRFKRGGRILHDRYPLRLDQARNLLAIDDLGIEAEGNPVEMRYAGPVFIAGEQIWALEG